mmetsp:Transcript_24431/g.41521  ORF Transcript_24431/g.41521 Transcript_24431/m.41521 type:complete len:239 (-) Transcript_24431:7-723(-)
MDCFDCSEVRSHLTRRVRFWIDLQHIVSVTGKEVNLLVMTHSTTEILVFAVASVLSCTHHLCVTESTQNRRISRNNLENGISMCWDAIDAPICTSDTSVPLVSAFWEVAVHGDGGWSDGRIDAQDSSGILLNPVNGTIPPEQTTIPLVASHQGLAVQKRCLFCFRINLEHILGKLRDAVETTIRRGDIPAVPFPRHPPWRCAGILVVPCNSRYGIGTWIDAQYRVGMTRNPVDDARLF